jgi:hypothetical protein
MVYFEFRCKGLNVMDVLLLKKSLINVSKNGFVRPLSFGDCHFSGKTVKLHPGLGS